MTGIDLRLDMQSAGLVLTLLANTTVSLSGNAGAAYPSTCTSSQILSLGGTLYDCGGASDTWGRSWTSSELGNTNFRVRVAYSVVLGTLFLDYVAVNVHYTPFTRGRGVLKVSPTANLAFSGQTLGVTGFPAGTQIYVDGHANGAIDGGWHQVVITSPSPFSVSSLELGRGPPLHRTSWAAWTICGSTRMALTPAQIDALFAHPECVP